MQHAKTIFVFDKDKKRIKKIKDAIGDRYLIQNISKSEDIPEDLKDLAGMVVDPEIKDDLNALAIDILKQKRVPVFVWAPIGKPPSTWEYSLPVTVMQSPPSVRSISESMLPVLETEHGKLVILATSDDKLTNELASGLIEKGYEVKRALDRERLEEQIKEFRDETALIFADMKFAKNLAEPEEIGPRIPLVINVPGSLGGGRGPVKIEPLVTLVNSGMRSKEIADTIERAITEGEKAIMKEAAIRISHNESIQSGRMTERLLNLLVEDTEKKIQETRAEEFNILNARTMGLIDEFFDLLNQAHEKSHILFEALDTPELEEEVFEINQKLSQAREILDALYAVDWYDSESAPEPLNMRKVVSYALTRMKANRRRKDIEWKKKTRDAGLTIGSKDQLVEALMHIMTNSYEAFDEKGTIEITTSTDDNWNYVEISDNGPGIPKDIINKTTKPFFTTKSANHDGLGLTIARNIIETHNGEMSIITGDSGTTVKFKLPRVREGKKLIEKSENPDIMLIAPPKSLGFLQSMLTEQRFAVVTYDNLGEAIHALKRISPQMILVQSGLEYMDVSGMRMLSGVKGDAKLVLLDPQKKLPSDIEGLDSKISSTYPSHQLIAIISGFLKDEVIPTKIA